MDPIRAINFTLARWQTGAVEAWVKGAAERPHFGTLETFKGAGKALIALACAERAAADAPHLRLPIVLPSEVLADQWRRVMSLADHEVGLLGAGGHYSVDDKRALVVVVNTAASDLPTMVARIKDPTVLVVDECHRAGAPSFLRVLDTAST